MKRTRYLTMTAIFCVFILLAGCMKTEEIQAVQDEDEICKHQDYCTQFNDAVVSEHPTRSALHVINACLQDLDLERTTRIILRYEQLLNEKKAYFSNILFSGENHQKLYKTFPDGFNPQRVGQIEDKSFRAILQEILDSGYTLKKSEVGLYQVEIDYTFFETYRAHLTPEIQAYFDIVREETGTPYFGEYKTEADPESLGRRLELLDAYLFKYPKSERLDALSRKANRYLLILAYGGEGYSPYDENDVLKPAYLSVYQKLASGEPETAMRYLFKGLVDVLQENDLSWNDDVYDYIIAYPEVYLKRYIKSTVYTDAYVDVGFGWTKEGDFYYYPVFSGITDRAESGKLSQMARSVVEKRMLGRGIDGRMYTGGKYIWSDFDLTFNRKDWISLKYAIYVEQANGSGYWTTEGLNYDLKEKRRVRLADVVESAQEREKINTFIRAYFDNSQTLYGVSLEKFYKNTNPNFYITDNGINILVPLDDNTERLNKVVEIFIPFKKFKTSVEYIYKMPVFRQP
jgi:hypothetical protein